MVNIKASKLYSEVIKEFNYSFGNLYIFKEFIVSEINQGIILNWDDHAKLLIDDVSHFFEVKGQKTNGGDLIYISNRINSYSVIASDWLKFFKHSYSLKDYCIVSENKVGVLGSMIEKLFYTKKIKHFNNLYTAINFVKKGVADFE